MDEGGSSVFSRRSLEVLEVAVGMIVVADVHHAIPRRQRPERPGGKQDAIQCRPRQLDAVVQLTL